MEQRAALLVMCFGCAHAPPAATAPGELPRELRPTRVIVVDARRDASGPQLGEAVRARAVAQLKAYGVPVSAEAALEAQIEIVDISTVWGQGNPRSCVKLLGRVVRDGQAFAALDTASQRCTGDDRYSAFHDLSVLGALDDPAHQPTPAQELLIQALDPLLVQLAQRCR